MNIDNTLKMPELLSMDIITLKSTTNPPIIKTVLIDDIILFCKMLPRVPSLGGAFFLCSTDFACKFETSDLHFQNLKIMPTVRLAIKWVIYSKSPNCGVSKKRYSNSSNNKKRTRIICKGYKSFSFFFSTNSFFFKIS